MKKNSRKNATATKHDHPGRPKYTPLFPRSKEWTFTDFMEVNGINVNTQSKDFGKGPNCTMLTLRKFMARDAKRMGKSLIFRVKGETEKPNSKDGLGRRAYLYSLRANANVKRGMSAPRKVKAAVSKVDSTPAPSDVSDATKHYEEIKAILAAPSAPAVTIPAVTIAPAPEAPAVAPEAAPAVETPAPAPVAQESANAETATPVAAPVTA